MSQNPEVKLAHNTELAFTEAHLTDLKPESCDLPEDCRAASHGSFFVPFLPVILIFVYFCLKVDEESDLLFFVQTSVNCYY